MMPDPKPDQARATDAAPDPSSAAPAASSGPPDDSDSLLPLDYVEYSGDDHAITPYSELTDDGQAKFDKWLAKRDAAMADAKGSGGGDKPAT
jgi:hypothetical protein